MIEAFSVVVQIRNRIQERMTNTLQVQRPIRVAHIEAFVDQAGCQKFSALAVTTNIEQKVFALFPDVCSARHSGCFQLPRMSFDLVVSEYAKRRNDVFGEVLVLVVAPDQNEVRLEVIQSVADGAHSVEKRLAM